MALLDVRHPFFLPKWRRVVLVVLLLGWAVVEFSLGNVIWAIPFAALGLFCLYEYFIIFDPENYRNQGDGK